MTEEYDIPHPPEKLILKSCHYIQEIESKSRELQWIRYTPFESERNREARELELECEISELKFKLTELNISNNKFNKKFA